MSSNEPVRLFDFANCYDFNRKIDYLSQCCPENWGEQIDNKKNPILHNYIHHTFSKLYLDFENAQTQEEKNQCFQIVENKHAIFNTGLYDQNDQMLYAYFTPNTFPKVNKKWYFNSFLTEYALSIYGINEYPLRANYFNNPKDLVFNVNYKIVPQYNHIFGDEKNYNRIPISIRELNNRTTYFDAAISKSKIKIDCNYKIAIPQFYRDRIQILVPLYLTNPIKADLALVVSRDDINKKYLGHTCLTIEMAYNNARLIAKPDSDWLKP